MGERSWRSCQETSNSHARQIIHIMKLIRLIGSIILNETDQDYDILDLNTFPKNSIRFYDNTKVSTSGWRLPFSQLVKGVEVDSPCLSDDRILKSWIIR